MSFGVTFCLITGASRGIGQQIGIQIASKIANGSVILLLSRTLSGLQDTKNQIEEVNGKIQVVLEAVDLEQEISNEEYAGFINNAIKKSDKPFQTALLVHNAASLYRNFTLTSDDANVLKKDLFMNVAVPILLNAQFFKIFDDKTPKRIVVQISSLTSFIPMQTVAMYGAIKAARNQFFKTLALENPTIQVLSYDPGVVDTEMYRDETPNVPSIPLEQRPMFWESLGYPVIQPKQAATALVEILLSGDFESGSFQNYTKDMKQHEVVKEKYSQMLKRYAAEASKV